MLIIWGWLRHPTFLARKMDECPQCGQVGPHDVARVTSWIHVFRLPVLLFHVKHGLVCARCGHWTGVSWRQVRTGMKSGLMPLDRPRPQFASTAGLADPVTGRRTVTAAEAFDPLVVNPK